MKSVLFDRANGMMPVSLGWFGAYATFNIHGGPFDKCPPPDKAFCVCVRAERATALYKDVWLPIDDFEVPENGRGQVDLALRQTLEAALNGRDVYVGCMGGWGRTGLFLALLAKASGQADPVKYVRESYTPQAVETEAQRRFVADFDVDAVRSWMLARAWRIKVHKTLFWWVLSAKLIASHIGRFWLRGRGRAPEC
jgi:hypothetical protein